MRRRLRPLILDPDDPVYPGSPDAPDDGRARSRCRRGTAAAPPPGGRTGRRPRRPSPTDTGPPSAGQVRRARPDAQPAPRADASLRPDRRRPPRTGTGGHAAPGHRTGGQPEPAARRAATEHRSGPQAAADPARWPPRPARCPPSGVPRAELAAVRARPARRRSGPDPSRSSARSPGRAGGPPAPTPGGAPGREPADPSALAAAPDRCRPTPVPAGPPPRPTPTGRSAGRPGPSGWVAAGLVVAGAAVVLAGIAAGWAVTRTVAGESPVDHGDRQHARAP